MFESAASADSGSSGDIAKPVTAMQSAVIAETALFLNFIPNNSFLHLQYSLSKAMHNISLIKRGHTLSQYIHFTILRLKKSTIIIRNIINFINIIF
jgi:hypothetical protein